MAWKGRQLTGHTKNGVTSTFKYDADGLRSSKSVGGVKTEYQYVGDQLFYEKRGDNQEFYYFYDSYGNLSKIYYTFIYGDTTSRAVYHTLTNAQGDVIALYNSSGTLVAQYEYDAWGNTLSVTDASGNEITAWYNIANANPIRYRGYYYDSDLGLYYLQSRYYDATIGRFINADGTFNGNGDLIGFNMFAYCGNNPVMFIDPTGYGWFRDLVDAAVDMMQESDSEIIKGIGDFCDQQLKAYDASKSIVEAGEKVEKASVIKNQYVQDIVNCSEPNYATSIASTPDPKVFSDVSEYRVQCADMYNMLYSNDAYLPYTCDGVTGLVNTMIDWDPKTTIRIGLVTSYYVLCDLFEAAKELW